MTFWRAWCLRICFDFEFAILNVGRLSRLVVRAMILRYFVCPVTPRILVEIVKAALSQFHNEINESGLVTESQIIICQPSEFLRYSILTRDIENVDIVTLLWVFYSCAKKKLLPFESYTADPRLIFSGLSFNTQHLDDCCMTDMYKDVIVFFGGRITDGQTDCATHTIMETKPYNSNCRSEATTITFEILASTPISVDSLLLFVDAYCQISNQSSRVSQTRSEVKENIIVNSSGTHTVSYSWLDDCISQKVKLPESAYYTTPKDHDCRQSTSKIEGNQMSDCEFLNRNNESLPLQGVSVNVSKKINKRLREVLNLVTFCQTDHSFLTVSLFTVSAAM